MNATKTYNAPADIDARRSRSLVIGVAALVLCAIGFFINRDQFFRAWLIGYMLWLGVALGSMGLMMIHHLSGGGWGMVVRRVWEASSRTLPLLTILFIPVALGMNHLYPWTHTELMQTDEVLKHKAMYLNPTFFLARSAVYFLGWNWLAWRMTALSRSQDEGDIDATRSMQRLSGFGLVFLGLSITFVGVDWFMSLNRLHDSDRVVPAHDGHDGAAHPAVALRRLRQAHARVRDDVGLLPVLAVPAGLRGEPEGRNSLRADAD
ncbi:MAG: hypothetical protein DMF88_20940 [Acidobacteria bacterium]|nr:MAG: hypothetical protein DMF88_20940 [Acidobacteriota bacterium]